MNIDLILDKMSTIVEKDRAYLKGRITKEKGILDDQFGTALTDTRKEVLALQKVAKFYGMSKNDIKKLEGDDTEVDEIEDIIDEIDDDIEDDYVGGDDEVFTTEDTNYGNPVENAWKDAFNRTPDPVEYENTKTTYEKTPSLIVEIGPTYYLKVDTTERPYEHEFEGKWGPYTKTAIKVFLEKVSDVEMYETKYTSGDFEGKPAFVDGQKYTMWMDEKCFGYFKLFWQKVRGETMPDDRVFKFKKDKKGNFNQWIFGEV